MKLSTDKTESGFTCKLHCMHVVVDGVVCVSGEGASGARAAPGFAEGTHPQRPRRPPFARTPRTQAAARRHARSASRVARCHASRTHCTRARLVRTLPAHRTPPPTHPDTLSYDILF